MNEERLHSPGLGAARLIAALKSHLPHLIAKHDVPGLNIALAHGGRLVWEAGFGWADIAGQRPMRCDTTYRSGSMGKVYTATAVMILVDRGVIALDDPINKHLPFEVHNPLGEREITVHDLLVHKSGLSTDAAGSQWGLQASLADTLKAEYAREFSPMMGGASRRWIHAVGAAWNYSNLGVATLGLIVEHANPERLGFPEFVQREIMDPLGMTLSQYPAAQHPDHVRPDIWAGASTGYSRLGRVHVPSFPLCFGEYPAGGVMARPADHVRLLLAMMNGGELDGRRILAEATARAMLSPATVLTRTPQELAVMGLFHFEQGLMWRLNDVGKPWTSFDHGGGHMWGWRTQGRGWPVHRVAVMVAVNQWVLPDDSPAVQEVLDFIGAWLTYAPPVDADAPPVLPASAMSYARGVLLAVFYRMIAVTGDAPPQHWQAVQQGARSRGEDWDAAAFRRGFEAVLPLALTADAVRTFLASAASEVDAKSVRTAALAMGARVPGLLNMLLPD